MTLYDSESGVLRYLCLVNERAASERTLEVKTCAPDLNPGLVWPPLVCPARANTGKLVVNKILEL